MPRISHTTKVSFAMRARLRLACVMVSLCAASFTALAEDSKALDNSSLSTTFFPVPPAPSSENKASSLPSLHSDIKFSVFAPPRKVNDSANADDAMLKGQTLRIAESLQAAARGLYAHKMSSLGGFDVYIAESKQAETLSSATGKIALYGGIAELKPADDWLAFVIAREMGHVLAGHHDQNSAASILTSVIMNLLIPGSSLIKSALSLAGSQVAAASGADKQVQEADDIALKLLEAAGYTSRSVALNLTLGPLDESLGDSAWARSLRKSAQTLIASQSRTPAGQVREVARGSVTVTGIPIAHASTAANTGASAGAPATTPAAGSVGAFTEVPASAPAAQAPSITITPVVRRAPLDEMPLVRTRPSGVAGPLMLGGYVVPVRRIE